MESNKSMSITGITDLDVEIMYYLENKDLYNLCQVDSYYKQLCQNHIDLSFRYQRAAMESITNIYRENTVDYITNYFLADYITNYLENNQNNYENVVNLLADTVMDEFEVRYDEMTINEREEIKMSQEEAFGFLKKLFTKLILNEDTPLIPHSHAINDEVLFYSQEQINTTVVSRYMEKLKPLAISQFIKLYQMYVKRLNKLFKDLN